VIPIGISTGALLATMAALEGDTSRIAALILLSPNFGLADWRGKFVSGLLGPYLARPLIGADYSFQPDSAGHAEFWTTRYPSQAIVAAMDLVNHAIAQSRQSRDPDLDHLFRQRHGRRHEGDPRRFDEIEPRKTDHRLPEASRHELTGDALAPETGSRSWRRSRDPCRGRRDRRRTREQGPTKAVLRPQIAATLVSAGQTPVA
jgi:hypothetical protein